MALFSSIFFSSASVLTAEESTQTTTRENLLELLKQTEAQPSSGQVYVNNDVYSSQQLPSERSIHREALRRYGYSGHSGWAAGSKSSWDHGQLYRGSHEEGWHGTRGSARGGYHGGSERHGSFGGHEGHGHHGSYAHSGPHGSMHNSSHRGNHEKHEYKGHAGHERHGHEGHSGHHEGGHHR